MSVEFQNPFEVLQRSSVCKQLRNPSDVSWDGSLSSQVEKKGATCLPVILTME